MAAAGSSQGAGNLAGRLPGPLTALPSVLAPGLLLRPAQPRTQLPQRATPPGPRLMSHRGGGRDQCSPRRQGPRLEHFHPLGKGDVHPGSAGSNLMPKRTGQRQGGRKGGLIMQPASPAVPRAVGRWLQWHPQVAYQSQPHVRFSICHGDSRSKGLFLPPNQAGPRLEGSAL